MWTVERPLVVRMANSYGSLRVNGRCVKQPEKKAERDQSTKEFRSIFIASSLFS